MGGYKPEFQSIPDNYYPLNNIEVFKYVTFVVSIILGSLAIMIAFLFWCTDGGLNSYAIVWSVLFLLFVVVLMILFYVGGRNRIK